MKTYYIKFSYTGMGDTFIEANSEEEARNLFYSGEWEVNEDDSQDYTPETIKLVKE